MTNETETALKELIDPNLAADVYGTYLTAPALTPREAQGIDQKLDDGFPDRGIVFSTILYGTPGDGLQWCGPHYQAGYPCGDTTTSGTCYDNSTVGQGFYLTKTNAQANTIGCALLIRASF